jgi:hypothetical protein
VGENHGEQPKQTQQQATASGGSTINQIVGDGTTVIQHHHHTHLLGGTDVDRPYKNLVHRVIAAIFVALAGKYGSTAVVLAVTWFGLELPVIREGMRAHAHDELLSTVLLFVVAVPLAVLWLFIVRSGKVALWQFRSAQVLFALFLAALKFYASGLPALAMQNFYSVWWPGVASLAVVGVLEGVYHFRKRGRKPPVR